MRPPVPPIVGARNSAERNCIEISGSVKHSRKDPATKSKTKNDSESELPFEDSERTTDWSAAAAAAFVVSAVCKAAHRTQSNVKFTN